MQAIRSKLLRRALLNVPTEGFHYSALQKAAEDMQLSPAILGSVQPVDLVVTHQRDLISHLSTTEEDYFKSIEHLFNQRFEEMCKVSSHWADAVAILKNHPMTATDLLSTHAHFILHTSGDTSVDHMWYIRQPAMCSLIAASDLYMIQDQSNHFEATKAFISDGLQQFRSLHRTSNKINLKVSMALNSFLK